MVIKVDPEQRFNLLEQRLAKIEETAEYSAGRFPKNALSAGIVPEGHLHYLRHHRGGGGLIHYDYAISAAYTGPDGAIMTSWDGSETRLYETIRAAVVHANANRQTSGQDTTFYLVGGTHTVATEIDITQPAGGSWWHFIGEGRDRVTISGTLTSGNVFDCGNVSAAGIHFSNLTITTIQAVTLIMPERNGYTYLEDLTLDAANASAAGIKQSGDVNPGFTAIWGRDVRFTGSGYGVDSTATTNLFGMRLRGAFFNNARGIALRNDADIFCTDTEFDCSTADIQIQANAAQGPLRLGFANCQLKKGLLFLGVSNVSA